jgi:alkylhydroperoxidase family enzyme
MCSVICYTLCTKIHFFKRIVKLIFKEGKMNEQRIKAVDPPYAENIQKDFDTIMPAGIPPLNIFRTVANNPRILHRMVIGGLLDKGSISLKDRELVILRACARCNAEYEWGVHVAGFASRAEISQEQITDTINITVDQTLWSDKQIGLLEMVDQLHERQTCSDDLWDKLCGYYKDDQLIELIMLAGLYHAISFIVNSLRIANEAFAPTFQQI